MRCFSSTQGYLVSSPRQSSYLIYAFCDILQRFFNDAELKNSTKHKIEVKQNVYSLTVNKCDHPDVGAYRAHIDNGIDHTDQTAQLKVGGMSNPIIE